MLKKMISVFESYGFEPLETPPVELKEILTGKIGAEEKLIYDVSYKGDTPLALRYDLTVPLARVVAQYPDLPKPFKRYQIGNSYRGENTQKGRFRQFLQVDVDTVGSSSPLADAEIIAAADATMRALGFKNYSIRFFSRDVLFKKIEEAGIPENQAMTAIRSIDKIRKIGWQAARDDMVANGIPFDQAVLLDNKLSTTQLTEGENMNEIYELCTKSGVNTKNLIWDPRMARGLDYYTGIIFECYVEDYGGGSVGGGGRYDNLIEKYSGIPTPAVGFSFGLDRVIEAMDSQNPQAGEDTPAKALVTVMSEELAPESFKIAEKLRKFFPTELYVGSGNLEKQLKYADERKIPFVIILGQKESGMNLVTLRNMAYKTQKEMISFEEATNTISNTK